MTGSLPCITATIRLPDGYATAREFADDCGFDLVEPEPSLPAQQMPDPIDLEAFRIERDLAQAACTAWRDVFKGIEAHLQDRIAMRDPASPETYLSIIRNSVADVDRDSHAIVNSRWADSGRYQLWIERLERELAEARSLAVPSTEGK